VKSWFQAFAFSEGQLVPLRFGQLQETDTHYFATDNKGSFNYRLIYRFTLPVGLSLFTTFFCSPNTS
jgi:hypothetical protein